MISKNLRSAAAGANTGTGGVTAGGVTTGDHGGGGLSGGARGGDTGGTGDGGVGDGGHAGGHRNDGGRAASWAGGLAGVTTGVAGDNGGAAGGSGGHDGVAGAGDAGDDGLAGLAGAGGHAGGSGGGLGGRDLGSLGGGLSGRNLGGLGGGHGGSGRGGHGLNTLGGGGLGLAARAVGDIGGARGDGHVLGLVDGVDALGGSNGQAGEESNGSSSETHCDGLLGGFRKRTVYKGCGLRKRVNSWVVKKRVADRSQVGYASNKLGLDREKERIRIRRSRREGKPRAFVWPGRLAWRSSQGRKRGERSNSDLQARWSRAAVIDRDGEVSGCPHRQSSQPDGAAVLEGPSWKLGVRASWLVDEPGREALVLRLVSCLAYTGLQKYRADDLSVACCFETAASDLRGHRGCGSMDSASSN